MYGFTRECLHDFKNKASIPSGLTPECKFKESSISKISTSDIFQELMLRLKSFGSSKSKMSTFEFAST